MSLTANANISFITPVGERTMQKRLVAAAAVLYMGAFVGRDPAGYAKKFEPGDVFDGIADYEFNNASGAAGAAAGVGTDLDGRGMLDLTVITQCDFSFTLSGVGVDDIGKAVFATDDNALSFTGNADAFVGRVHAVLSSGKAIIRMRQPGEKTTQLDIGCLRLWDNGSGMREPTGAASTTKYYENGFTAKSILGLGVSSSTGSGGGIEGEFDAVQEVALASLRTNDLFPVSGGIRMKARLCMTDKGGQADINFDWGLGTLLTANSEVDLSHADMVNKIAFHMDGNSDNINGWSENANTEVAAVDTTIDNDSTTDTYKDFLIIVRTSGVCELWIDSGAGFVRVLDGTTGAATTLSVAANVALAAFVNLEKASDAAALAAKFKLREIEVTGSRTITVGA